jgi:hypothetical protein
MRRMRSGCCARAANGHATAAEPAIILMNSRRLMAHPRLTQGIVQRQTSRLEGVGREEEAFQCPLCANSGQTWADRFRRVPTRQTFAFWVALVF